MKDQHINWDQWSVDDWERVDQEGYAMRKLPAGERISNFNEVELGFTPAEVLAVARRCMACDTGVCVGCKLCEYACPDQVIHIINELDPSQIKYVTTWDEDIARCCYCGLCVEACPTKTLQHDKDYELSVYDRSSLVWDKDQLCSKKKGRERPRARN